MLIIGAKGFAKQLIEVMDQLNLIDQVALFDDVTKPEIGHLHGIPILHSETDVLQKFQKDKRFVLGTGNPRLRRKLAEKFMNLGGALETVLSPKASISRFETNFGKGTTLLSNVIVEGNVSVGEGALINVGVIITHDCTIGNYVEICPGVKISGNCRIGSFTMIGTGAVLIPGLEIGNNVVIAAGSVVTKNIPDNVMVAGVPASIRKRL